MVLKKYQTNDEPERMDAGIECAQIPHYNVNTLIANFYPLKINVMWRQHGSAYVKKHDNMAGQIIRNFMWHMDCLLINRKEKFQNLMFNPFA